MNVPATRPQQQQQKAVAPIIRNPDELQMYMMKIIESKSFAERYKGIVDRKTLFLAVQGMRSLWWQIKDLENFDWGSVIVAAGQAAAYGWSVDGVTGHAFMVPYGNQVKLQPGYKGWLDLVNRAGKCLVTMQPVYQGDKFEFRGVFQQPVHVRSNDPTRRLKPLTHVYVLAGFGGNLVKCFCWTKEECIAHRDRFSKGWRGVRGRPDKEGDSPWNEKHPGFWVMCAKSVLSDAARHGELPYSLEHSNPNLPPIDLLEDEETIDVVSFQSPAGFVEQSPADPGDDIAADAQQEIQEQTLPTLDPATDAQTDPLDGFRFELSSTCRTPGDVETCVNAWCDLHPELRMAIIAEGNKKSAELQPKSKPRQRPLPGE